MLTEAELIKQLNQKWPTVRRWIEVSGVTRIYLDGSVEDNNAFLSEMAMTAFYRQNKETRVEFSFLVSGPTTARATL